MKKKQEQGALKAQDQSHTLRRSQETLCSNFQ